MLFHVYGSNAVFQWAAMLGVLAALILLNEFSRSSKCGGMIMFFIVPAILTAYFVAIHIGAALHQPCQTVCGFSRLYRLYDDQIWVGYWKNTLV